MGTEVIAAGRGRGRAWLVAASIVCALALVAGLLVVLLGGGDGSFARLRPLDPSVEVRAGGEGDYALGEMGQELIVGDAVRTDEQGRCEITYHEGSLTRLGPDTVFELVELTDAPALHLRLETGKLWQRVARLTGTEGSFRLHTPAATATVAGTVFAVDCTEDGACTFTVVEGTLRLTTTTGEELTLEAGEQVTIAPDGTAEEPRTLDERALWADDWIAYNLERDGEASPPPPDPRQQDAGELLPEGRQVEEVQYAELTGESPEEIIVKSQGEYETRGNTYPINYVDVFTWDGSAWVNHFDGTGWPEDSPLFPDYSGSTTFVGVEEPLLVTAIDFASDGTDELVIAKHHIGASSGSAELYILSLAGQEPSLEFDLTGEGKSGQFAVEGAILVATLPLLDGDAPCCPSGDHIYRIGWNGERIDVLEHETVQPLPGDAPIDLRGIGPIEAGMTIREAEEVSRRQISFFERSFPPEFDCDVATFASVALDDLELVVSAEPPEVASGRPRATDLRDWYVTAVTTGEAGRPTISGVEVGSSEQEVYDAYGHDRIEESQDEFSALRVLTYVPEEDTGFRVRFTLEEGGSVGHIASGDVFDTQAGCRD